MSDRSAAELMSAMRAYRAIAGQYPYDYWTAVCPGAFRLYLGDCPTGPGAKVKPEMLEDVRKAVALAVRFGDDYPWDELRALLAADGRDWHAWHDRELYVHSVAPRGGARALREAHALGFVDHRLEHALTTIQRLVRYRRASPEGSMADFEALHHRREPSWPAHGVHLRSFAETGAHFDTEDQDAEVSFVWWNRQCIPEFLAELTRRGVDTDADFEFASGVAAHLGWEEWDELLTSIKRRREALYERSLAFLTDDDALAKIAILARLHAEGGLGRARNARRDVLKFVCFAVNEPAPGPAARVRGTPVARCYLDRLDALPLCAAEAVFRALPDCLATRGRDIVHRFSKVDLPALDTEGVRAWFRVVVVDELRDVCAGPEAKGAGVELGAFKRYLAAPAARPGPAADLARALLGDAQRRVRSGRPLYEYTVWAEPVTVSPVVLVSDREAALGSGAPFGGGNRGLGRDAKAED